MNQKLSLDSSSTQSDVFYVECPSEERNHGSEQFSGGPQFQAAISSNGKRDNHNLLRCFSGATIVTIKTDPNEPTIPLGFGNQHSIVPSSLNDLNLPPNHSTFWLLWP